MDKYNNEYVFGANILENLTTGMYKDSKVIYREYIQNACDQIDKAVKIGLFSSKQEEGIVEIWIDEKERKISIEDNATGIPSADFKKILANIADSDKRIGEDKGFRGIGRLCGLAYCRRLIFESKAAGEDIISVMNCDAEEMRKMLVENASGQKVTASEILHKIFIFDQRYITSAEDETIEKHWFKVELIDINDENTDLLDIAKVLDYLTFVAPVPYVNAFYYRNEIYKHAKELGYTIDEYNIKVNGEYIFKKYETRFKTRKGDYDIFDIHFKDFRDDTGNLIAWMWFGISQFDGIMESKCKMRSLRLRKENIQIGNEDTLQKLFKEDRGPHYYAGEVFAVSKELIPNSQRDYFNENPMRVLFENKLEDYFNLTLKKVYYQCSRMNSAYRSIDGYQNKFDEHKKKSDNNEYIAEQKQKAEDDLKKSEEKAKNAEKTLEKLKEVSGSEDSEIVNRIITRIEKKRKESNKEVTAINNTSKPVINVSEPKKAPHRTDKLSRCSKQERKLIGKIYGIIYRNTDEATAEKIIRKIEDEFK